jgi:hypothetical protein
MVEALAVLAMVLYDLVEGFIDLYKNWEEVSATDFLERIFISRDSLKNQLIKRPLL